MPIYVYQCSSCGASTEEIQKLNAPPPKKCPHCGKPETLKKQMGISNFELKGSGWAKDGYG